MTLLYLRDDLILIGLMPVSFSIECLVCIVFVHTVSEIFLDILQEVSGLSQCKCCFAPEVVRAFHSTTGLQKKGSVTMR